MPAQRFIQSWIVMPSNLSPHPVTLTSAFPVKPG
jgi:hypothetical protein